MRGNLPPGSTLKGTSDMLYIFVGIAGGAAPPAANGAPVDRPRKKKRRFDAILSVQTANPAPARVVMEEVLAAEARRWQIDEITPKKSGRTALKYVVRLEAGKQPEAVLDLLVARGAPHVLGASLR